MSQPTAEQLREQAHHILRGRKFRGTHTPAPFRGVLQALGRFFNRILSPVGGPIGRFFVRVWAETVGRVLIGVVVLALLTLITFAIARRRSVRAVGGHGRRGSGRPEDADPDALEREADRAEQAGDLERALRLRFVAGLARLHRAGAVRLPETITTGAVGRQLESPEYDELGRTFDAVAYGHRPVTAEDVAAARDGWPRVLAGSGAKK
ncbi:MAG: DUF4129 domain-containing protein [Actinobacteria bacterium]|nr:DUF4129 domain-containing protein [Actinomycetota bacterium]